MVYASTSLAAINIPPAKLCIITSAEEVLFSSVLVGLFVCMFVSRITQIHEQILMKVGGQDPGKNPFPGSRSRNFFLTFINIAR